MEIIRVFPRRTSLTPKDAYAFTGDPPLWRPEADEVHVSVTFTWDVVEGYRLRDAWAQYYPVVRIGGPAIAPPINGFEPGMYIRNGVTFTSRGCLHHCPWCLVPEREGTLRLLNIKPGWIIQDNNLLATPRKHQEQVYAMLRSQRRKVDFAGGLEAARIDDWVAEQLQSLRIGQLFLACDTVAALEPLRQAVSRLSFLNRRQLRCYVLIGFREKETIGEAEKRLEEVWQAGCLPFAQLYRSPDRYIKYSPGWKTLARQWSRSAIMFSRHTDHNATLITDDMAQLFPCQSIAPISSVV